MRKYFQDGNISFYLANWKPEHRVHKKHNSEDAGGIFRETYCHGENF